MKTSITRSATFSILVAVCCSLVFFSSCRIVTNKLAETYSGQTLFDGIFMSNGDILSFDTEIQNDVQAYLKTDKQKQAFLKFEKELVSQLAKDNPDFVREFYNKMYSKDKEKVKETLERCSRGGPGTHTCSRHAA